jgi:hypothetical protein
MSIKVERAVRDPGRFWVCPGVTIYGLVSSFSLQTSEVKVRRSPGVFNTDQVKLDRMRFPASELMRADQNHHRECLRRGVGLGMPVHMQHDMHRLIGWSRPLGLYADSEMVRVLGLIEEPETEQEKAELQARAAAYWEQYHCEGAEPYRDELIARVAPADLGNACFLKMEAVVVERLGIAAELYPDLFTPGLDSVDKDGLADYHDLLRRMKQVQPGVFHDRDRDLLLFAHRFFRRSLSHRNKLNAYFLQSFDATASENGDLCVRLRLDPDLVGHPASTGNLIELEHWRGPLYSDDIAAIPNGVAEHMADERTKLYEGVDRTQAWWKAPESRRVDGQAVDYRTFEIEELIENPSGGLGDNQFGCRYAHAEFSADEAAITQRILRSSHPAVSTFPEGSENGRLRTGFARYEFATEAAPVVGRNHDVQLVIPITPPGQLEITVHRSQRGTKRAGITKDYFVRESCRRTGPVEVDDRDVELVVAIAFPCDE